MAVAFGEEARHLVGAAPGGPSYKFETADQVQQQRLLERKPALSEYAAARSAALTRAAAPRLWPSVPSSSPFSRSDAGRRVVPSLLDDVQLARFEQDMYRSMLPSPSEQAAEDHRLVMECLRHYNLNHPENEYVPAPGMVTKYSSYHNGSCCTHGNFVASPKRSGCFSFLPAQRTLFFYELVIKDRSTQVVSCTPLVDEPVTESYSLFGLPLGWGTRRDGSLDCRCKTCDLLVDSPVPFVGKAFPCGHYKAECVCEMCYIHSGVLHPSQRKFAFGNG